MINNKSNGNGCPMHSIVHSTQYAVHPVRHTYNLPVRATWLRTYVGQRQ